MRKCKIRAIVAFSIISVVSPWLQPWTQEQNRHSYTIHKYKGDNFIDVEVLDSSEPNSKRNRGGDSDCGSYDNERMRQQAIMAFDLFEDQEEIRVMQWEKQPGDRINKGDTIVLMEGLDSFMGASSTLKVVKELIATHDGILKDIKVKSGWVYPHTVLALVEPVEILDVEFENTSTAEILKQHQEKNAEVPNTPLQGELYSIKDDNAAGMNTNEPDGVFRDMSDNQEELIARYKEQARVKTAEARHKAELEVSQELAQLQANAKRKTLKAKQEAHSFLQEELAKIREDTAKQLQEQKRLAQEKASRELQEMKQQIALVEQEKRLAQELALQELQDLKIEIEKATAEARLLAQQEAAEELERIAEEAKLSTQEARIKVEEQRAQQQELARFQAQVEEARRMEVLRMNSGEEDDVVYDAWRSYDEDDVKEDEIYRIEVEEIVAYHKHSNSSHRHSLFY